MQRIDDLPLYKHLLASTPALSFWERISLGPKGCYSISFFLRLIKALGLVGSVQIYYFL